jgi:hypothetical protein
MCSASFIRLNAFRLNSSVYCVGTSRSCAELNSGYAIEWIAGTGWTYVPGGREGRVESCNVTGFQKVTSHRNDLFPGWV